eukprot:1837167-Pleurochrysis_carterae.AAC.1
MTATGVDAFFTSRPLSPTLAPQSALYALYLRRLTSSPTLLSRASRARRGTPSSPGLVATLVRDADLVSLGLSAALAEP